MPGWQEGPAADTTFNLPVQHEDNSESTSHNRAEAQWLVGKRAQGNKYVKSVLLRIFNQIHE